MKVLDDCDKINKPQNQNVINCFVSQNKMMNNTKNNYNNNSNCIHYNNIYNKKD